jgi:hypothetical protein
MSDHDKITAMHLRRAAFVYIRQSTATQVEHNRESTARQYALADRAVELGWRRSPSLTRISAFLEPARRNVPALPN